MTAIFVIVFIIGGIICYAATFLMPKNEKYGADGGKSKEMTIVEPKIPNTLDVEFIIKECAKVRNAPNMLEAYYQRLRSNFYTEQERSILQKIINYSEILRKGIASRKEILREKRELEDEITAFNISKDEGLRKLKQESAILAEKAKHAEYHAIIREAELRGKERPEEARKKGKLKPTPEKFRDDRIKRLINKARDKRAEVGAIDEVLREVESDAQNDEKRILGDPNLTEEQRKEELYRSRTKYANLRAEIEALKL
ncbi:MAG: hypothetical protein C4567_17810 [Deltaproteobacteria bacterium]|nr:MAG: hypothetical protein C4567_17810 [Deltaproteobacteria bacterium]